jgi:hypothetical protein
MRVLLFLVCLISLASCTEISFRETQPKGIKNLKTFPSSLRGKYIIPDDSSNNIPDTLLISKQWYRISGGSEKEDWLNRGNLSDSLVLKKYKGYYFLNFLLEKQWVIRTFRQEKNGNIILLDVNLSDNKTLENLKTKLHPEIIKDESNTFYQVDPLPQDLLDFILLNSTAQQPLRKIK